MQGFKLSSLSWLLLSVALSLALPTSEEKAPLAPRARFCANSPHTVAGTKLSHRNPWPNPLQPRKGTEEIIWCSYGSQTYLLVTMAYQVGGNAIQSLLNAAYDEVMAGLDTHGDGLVAGGIFQKPGAGNVMLRTMNSNNHQLTYGVLGAALSGLKDYMSQYYYGAASFTINDGMIEVARGVIGIE